MPKDSDTSQCISILLSGKYLINHKLFFLNRALTIKKKYDIYIYNIYIYIYYTPRGTLMAQFPPCLFLGFQHLNRKKLSITQKTLVFFLRPSFIHPRNLHCLPGFRAVPNIPGGCWGFLPSRFVCLEFPRIATEKAEDLESFGGAFLENEVLSFKK